MMYDFRAVFPTAIEEKKYYPFYLTFVLSIESYSLSSKLRIRLALHFFVFALLQGHVRLKKLSHLTAQ